MLKNDYSNQHRDIVERVKKHDRLAQYQLYQLYSRAMYNICVRMLANSEDAEDALQEAFSEAFRRIDSFRFESTPGAWLKKIVINKCINLLRKKSLDAFLMDDMGDIEVPDDKGVDDDDIKYEVNKIRTAMQILPEGFRVILNLYLMEGYEHKEIAQILDISESTSKTQYHRAKKKLREIIKADHYG